MLFRIKLRWHRRIPVWATDRGEAQAAAEGIVETDGALYRWLPTLQSLA